MTLNQGQSAAAQAVFQFLFSDNREFVISGSAGVGKTFLMKHIMENVLQDYENASKLLGTKPVDYEVVLTATTNKATEVLAAATGFPALTIHGFMNLKVRDDHKTGISAIMPTNSWTVHQRKIIFVDEASMIDTALHDYIVRGTDRTCKIIYLGDHCQMAPVFETISPVYSQPKKIVLLTEPVRNAGQPALVNLCNQLRKTVETLAFKVIEPVPGVIEYLDDDRARAFINATFKDDSVNARILCYTNARVREFNQYIRTLRGYPEHCVQGEVLVNNTGIQIGKNFIQVEEQVRIRRILGQEKISIDPRDPHATLEVCNVELACRGGLVLPAKIPVDPEHHRLLIRHYGRIKDWARFYHLKNTFPDLRQKDATTVHKAQGSTYETVLLDLANIATCRQTDQLARMLYVGASRPTTRLYLYGKLPERLFARNLSEALDEQTSL